MASMGEIEYDVSGESVVVEDISEFLSRFVEGAFLRDDLSFLEAKDDAGGAVNLILSNGQGFRVTVEHDDFEKPGTA